MDCDSDVIQLGPAAARSSPGVTVSESEPARTGGGPGERPSQAESESATPVSPVTSPGLSLDAVTLPGCHADRRPARGLRVGASHRGTGTPASLGCSAAEAGGAAVTVPSLWLIPARFQQSTRHGPGDSSVTASDPA